MSNFGPIAYEDMSQLNAEWGQQRPPMAGLGGLFAGLGAVAPMAQHEYVDVSFLNARLRPIEPKRFGMGYGIGNGVGNGSISGNSLGIVAGLGGDPDYPWREYSSDTKALQEQTNEALLANGYAPITADGKLGPATCGAVRAMCATLSPPCDAPGSCQSFTAPSRPGALVKTSSSKPSVARASMMGGGTNWLLIGGAIGAIAIGGALMFKASKKR